MLAAQQPAPAGQPPPTAGLVKKGKAPVSNGDSKVKLPKPREATSPNGLHLMVLEDHRLPRVTFQITFRSGRLLRSRRADGLGDLRPR